jgi:hypothetical protein
VTFGVYPEITLEKAHSAYAKAREQLANYERKSNSINTESNRYIISRFEVQFRPLAPYFKMGYSLG